MKNEHLPEYVPKIVATVIEAIFSPQIFTIEYIILGDPRRVQITISRLVCGDMYKAKIQLNFIEARNHTKITQLAREASKAFSDAQLQRATTE